ncbi:MAG TPA: glucokinase [Gammaproteobacteria bacterium]|nr:glucokinase [Gammaproteobacteria bacterium]
MPALNILSADIGGTKIFLELTQHQKQACISVKKQKFSSASYASFEQILTEFLPPLHAVDIACFAVAGPIDSCQYRQTAKVTNLPWQLDNTLIQKTFNIPHIYFINDFQATAYAIPHLKNQDIEVLQQGGEKPSGIRAVIGAGTGLGEAILIHTSSAYEVIATEGGHQDFAATDDLEFQLFQHLQQQYPHVSYERILSGAGLICIFDFLANHSHAQQGQMVQDILQSADPAAAISHAANHLQYPIAEQSLHLFMKIYGAKAGNLALSCLPTAGLYISGGIAAKNLNFLKNSQFLTAFNAKGRMQPLLAKIPVSIITNQEAGLIGATHYAKSLA